MPSVAVCEHCGAALPQEHVESRLMQADLGLWPAQLLVQGEAPPVEQEAVVVAEAVVETPVSYVPKKRHTKRGDDYYYQLYFDYMDAAETNTDGTGNLQANSVTSNGNGKTSGASNGNGNSTGNGNGNGHRSDDEHAAQAVDLAIAETVPLTLFVESDMGNGVPAPATMEAQDKATSAGNYNDFEYELINDPSRLAQVAEMLAHETVLGVDTETTGLDPHISELLLLQVSTADKVYIVDCRRLVPLALKPVLENPNVLKIAQNAKFEYEMLKQQCGITLTNMYDTMLAERICTAGLGREISLKQIAARYVGAVLDKSVREAFYKLAHNGDAYLADEQLHYAARDAFIMIPIWRLQKQELKKHRLEDVADLEFRCIAAVGDLELAGVQIDTVKWRKIIEDVALHRERTAVELSEMLQPATMQATMFGIPSINLNSSTQLMEVFSKLGVDLPDTSEATLSKFNHPAVAKLLEYRSHEKTLSAFGENVLGLINPKTGRIHPDFNQHGADTGRFSCTRPNVQQIPATSDFRKCFVASEGYKLITCVAEGTRVLTTRGLIPIEQVVVGDQAIQEDGSTRLVQRVLNQGEKPTLRLRTALGYELVATPEHRVRILNADGDYLWEEVGRLQEASTVAIKIGSSSAFEGAKVRQLTHRSGISRTTNQLLANTRNRGSVVTAAIAERVRVASPEAASHLGLHHLLDNSMLFDRIVEVSQAGVQRVYDLTIEGTSTYLTQGFVSHNCDYSQAELRILAELSGDPGFVGAFQSGDDLHSLTASQMFGVPLAQVQKSQRSAAKAINFGLAYGMGPGGLAPRLGVTLDEAKELIARYFKAYPGVQQWLEKAGRDAVRNGYSITMLGRKRFYNIPDEGLKKINEDEWRKQIAAIERQGKNSPIQGCVSGDTRIFEETRGYVPIAGLRGQVVSVWDGSRFSQAVVVYSGKKQLVKVHLWDGNYIECSPDHRFLVRPTSGTDLWRTPAEFKPQQRLVLGAAVPEWGTPVSIPAHNCNGSWNAKSTSLGQISDPAALGEWLGRLASDGTVTSSTAALMVAEHEEVLLPRLQAISAELGHVGHSIRSTESKPRRFHKLTVSSRGLAQQLRELGVKERVPDCAWQDSRVLAGYLRGMFDGDGTVNRDGAFLVFGQRDKHLAWAREIQQALLLFGVRSRINICADRINVRVVKKDIPLFCHYIGFMNPAKQAKAVEVSAATRDKTYGRGVRVKRVEFTEEWVDMYDVVNSETSQFMANGLVVHNCNADMTKLALIYLRTALKDWDARTVNTVHDEIVVEARADVAEEVQHIVEDCMVRAGQYILKVVPIVAEASLADYWSK
ncbi:MAG TPA: DNA polymerase [Chloroflexia bacterium]